jgi:transposase
MQSKLRILEILHKEYLQTGNELRAYCRKHHKKDYYLLKSIPGIGGFLAAALLAEVGDIRRFTNEQEFSSYLGIVPGIHQSGETEKHMGVTPRCNSSLRSYLMEATWTTVRKDPEMQAYYRKHSARKSTTVIVKVAHKLVKRILSVIKNEHPYQINYAFNKKNIPSKQTTIQSQ